MNWLLSVAVGTATGILSGFGVGGGTLLLIYLTAFAHMDQNTAQAINLLYFLPAAAAALPAHKKNGYLRKEAACPAICWGLVTAAGAAFLANCLEVELLRKFFGAFLLYIGFSELFRKKDK